MRKKPMDSGKRKRSLFKRIVLAILVLIVSVLAVALLYLNVRKNEISEDLLKRVNRTFPGEFTVGSISVGDLFDYPNLEFTLRKLQFWESESGSQQRRNVIIEVPSARFKADLKDVLKSTFRIESLELRDPILFIERDSAGVQIISEAFKPIQREKKKDSEGLVVDIDHVELIGGRVEIIDRPSGVAIPISVEELVGDFELNGHKIGGEVDLRVNGKEIMDTLRVDTRDFDVRVKGTYDLDLDKRKLIVHSPLTEIGVHRFRLDVDFNYPDQNRLEMDLNSLDEGLSIDDMLFSEPDSLSSEDQRLDFQGVVGFESHLVWEPKSGTSFAESVALRFSIEGNDLKLKGADLDKFIDKFKRSQNFNLADVSAVLFAGPAGLAVTKGGDYASLAFATKGDSTRIGKFLAEWSIDKGELETRDVALSTKKHRLSVDGHYNLVSDSLRFKFHVLDKKGCELVGQKVYGTSADVKMGRVNLVKTFLGPVKNFFQDLGMVKCEIVYTGKVTHPELKKKEKSSGK